MKRSHLGINRDHSTIGVGENHASNTYRRQKEKYPYVGFMPRPQQTTALHSQRMDAGPTYAVRLKNNAQPVIEQTAQLHLENVCRNLEYRLGVAKAKGDKELLSLLHQESQQLALCTQGR